MPELVSVFMSVHDDYLPLLEQYILPSIINQTYKNFEIVIVGDGCDISRLEKDSIKTYSVEKHGHHGCLASNYALDHCNGYFLARDDADDIWTPNHLQLLIDKMLKDNLNIVSGKQIWKGSLVGNDKIFGPGKIAHSSTMWNRELGDFRYSYLEAGIDADLWQRMADSGKVRWGYVDEIITYECPKK